MSNPSFESTPSDGSTESNTQESLVSSNEGEPITYPTCTCGHNRFHHLVSSEPTYTAWGHFWVVLMGVSSSPIRLDFR